MLALVLNSSDTALTLLGVSLAGDLPADFTFLEHAMLYLVYAIQICAAILIALASAKAAYRALAAFFRPGTSVRVVEGVRLQLGRWLVLALEFQVAADILRTAIAPDWNEIGQLAAIIVLRTGLNFVLQKEIEHAESVEKGTALDAEA